MRRDYFMAETPSEYEIELAIEYGWKPYALSEATEGECVDMAVTILHRVRGIPQATLARLLGVSPTALRARITRCAERFGGAVLYLPFSRWWYTVRNRPTNIARIGEPR